MGVEVITVSPRGQIVLPKEMREALSISGGASLAAFATDNVIVLKPLKMPTAADFSKWLEEAQTLAKEAGYEETDVADVLVSVRRGKKK